MPASDLHLFETIVGSLPDGIYVIREGRAAFLNARFAEIFGLSHGDGLIGREMFTEVYPDAGSADLFRQVNERVLSGTISRSTWGQPSTRRDGTPIWIEVEARRVDLGGSPAVIGTLRDGTDCKLLGEAMHASQETLRLLLDAMEDRVYVVTDDYRIVYANRKLMAGVAGDLTNDPCYKVLRGLDQRCPDCSNDAIFQAEQPMYKEIFNETAKRWYSVIELPIPVPGVSRPTKLAVARDITVSRRSAGKIRNLSHRLLQAQEEERRHLSRDLHDNLGQQLSAVKMGLEGLVAHYAGKGCEPAAQTRRLSEILEGSIACVRDLTRTLRPPALERLGLVEAMRAHCKKVEELHPLSVSFTAAGTAMLRLEPLAEINLFRILQEALHNVVKHAHATAAKVHLIGSHPRIILRVEDDGAGFAGDPIATDREGVGIVGMAERVELLGGTFTVRSRPGQGTRIAVEIPVTETVEEPEPAKGKAVPSRPKRSKGGRCS